MKRKTFSILLALVLALSLCLVTAVPVAAATTHNVIPFTLINDGSGSAAWSTTQAHSGTSSVLLDAGTLGGANAGRIQVEVPAISMASFTGATFWVWEPTGTEHGGSEPNTDQIYPYGDPYINILIDTDGDGSFDEKMEGVGSITVGSPTSPATHPTPTAATWVQMEEGYGFYDMDDSLGSGIGQGPGGSGHPWDFGTLAEWKTWFASGAPQNTYTVVGVQITFGYWGPDVTLDVYVDDIAINGVTYHGLIQDAIDAAIASDIIVMAAGTYTEDLSIPAGKDNLELKPATGAAVTIKGVETEPDASFPLAVPNIDILSSGVKIHGFTIEGPDAVTDEYASGILIGAANVEIYDNDFKVTAGKAAYAGPISTGIITYRKTAIPTVDISGLNIHDNTFTNHGAGAAGYQGIYINIDAGTTTITIADNDFTGNVMRAIVAERSNVVISGNSIITDLAPWASAGGYQGMYIGCYELNVGEADGPVQSNVSITGNTVKGATSSDGFVQGIRIGHSSEQIGFSGITVSRNTVQYNTYGIVVKAKAGATPVDVVINYNYIVGNITKGIDNTTTDSVLIDAEYNWYGDVAGPDIGTNPYDGVTSGDVVSADVDYLPWMIHDTLVSGWNIWSTPIAAATGYEGEPDTNTVEEALNFWTADSTKVIDAYYFNSATQAWDTPTSLTPLQAVYLNLSASATIDVCVSDNSYAPPGRTMHLGWNLVGPAELDDMNAEDALITAFWGTGAVSLIGYQYAISPSVNQAAWTLMRGDVGTDYFVPTEGYWVWMVNQGTLGGFTYTPIVEVTP